MRIDIVKADYRNVKHAEEIVMLLNAYAMDPMGGGRPLTDHTRQNLCAGLSRLPHAFSLIAYADTQPAGLANCFELYSTFACRPLINVHDMVVLEQFRGRGLSRLILEKIEAIAVDKGCCKLTLEVLTGNTAARASYEKFGFSGYRLGPDTGVAQYWQKLL